MLHVRATSPGRDVLPLPGMASVAGNRTDLNERFSENEHELAVPKCVPLAMQIAQSTIDTNGLQCDPRYPQRHTDKVSLA